MFIASKIEEDAKSLEEFVKSANHSYSVKKVEEMEQRIVKVRIGLYRYLDISCILPRSSAGATDLWCNGIPFSRRMPTLRGIQCLWGRLPYTSNNAMNNPT